MQETILPIMPTWCQPLPACAEFHMGIKEANHRGGGDLPTLQPCPDQAFSPAVADNLHEAWVPLVDVLVQVELEFHCKGGKQASQHSPPTSQEGPEVLETQDQRG